MDLDKNALKQDPDQSVGFEDAVRGAIHSRQYERVAASMSDGRQLDLLVRLIADSKVLVVFGQDAIVRSRHTLPRFFRWSWVKEKPFSAIFLNDPTLYINEQIEGGWFQGTADVDYLLETAAIINRIATMLSLKNRDVIYFGASAGGFTSVLMASLSKANALVDIPQFDLLNYHIDSARQTLLETCYGKRESYEGFRSRLSAVDFMVAHNSWPKRLWIVQNLCDTRHIHGQFAPFLSRFTREVSDRNVAVDLSVFSSCRLSERRGGHIPEDEDKMLHYLEQLVSVSRQDPRIIDVDHT